MRRLLVGCVRDLVKQYRGVRRRNAWRDGKESCRKECELENCRPGPVVKNMFDKNEMKKSIYCLTLMFLLCAPAFAQQQSDRPRKTSEEGRNEYGVQQPPDLTQENLGRVAGSAIQIRSVLGKDEGLMVEFKRGESDDTTPNVPAITDST